MTVGDIAKAVYAFLVVLAVLALNVFVGYLVVRCGIWAFDDAAEGALIFMLSVALYALFIPVSICIAYLLLNIDID